MCIIYYINIIYIYYISPTFCIFVPEFSASILKETKSAIIDS